MSDPSGPTISGLAADLEEAVRRTIQQATDERWAGRIWDRDAGLWSSDPAAQEAISNRLGWLDAPARFRALATELDAFAGALRAEGCRSALVLGMGGSSLAPWVIGRVGAMSPDGIPVAVLDSTDPSAVQAATELAPPADTVYLVASKSGTTIETASFEAHFWRLEEELYGAFPSDRPGEHFAAITDPGPGLEHFRHRDSYRTIFLNPPDIGGRYSALTYVGLVPAALQGADVRGLCDGALAMADACRDQTAANPALVLGAALGALARAGRDKLTLLIEPGYAAFGAWLEQLIAESTGKAGTGIVPIVGEQLASPERYGADRVFVRLAPSDGDATWRSSTDGVLAALAALGQPVLEVALEQGLGGEFFRWEFATAVAGKTLGVDPFDEPNVTESKENTRRLLEHHRLGGVRPPVQALAGAGSLTLYGDAGLRRSAGEPTVPGVLARHLARVLPTGYLGLQAFLAPTPARDEALASIRTIRRDGTGRATTVAYGPRFLHSTGQLHKGGPRTGCFLQLTADHAADLTIPGAHETFGQLIDAQAAGDLEALEAHELPVLRVHLGRDPDAGLAELRSALEQAIART
ncbi:MAG: hypothetical protein ACXWPV_06600 [Candidatus Limnocylindrales bacterium]